MDRPVDLVRRRIARVAVAVDRDAVEHHARLNGVEIHASVDGSRVVFVQYQNYAGSFHFSVGWRGGPVHFGRWIANKPQSLMLEDQEISSGYRASTSRTEARIDGPGGVEVAFRRDRWLGVAAYRVGSGERIATFRAFRRPAFVSVAENVSDDELSCLVIAMGSGIVLQTRFALAAALAVNLWVLPWHRPVLRSQKSQRELARQLLGSIPVNEPVGSVCAEGSTWAVPPDASTPVMLSPDCQKDP